MKIAIILGSIGYVGKKAYDTYISFAYADDYQGAGEEELSVRIPTGASVNEVGEILVEEDETVEVGADLAIVGGSGGGSSESAPAEEPKQESTYFPNCKKAKESGAAPLHRGDPGYREELDRDGDGVACEFK